MTQRRAARTTSPKGWRFYTWSEPAFSRRRARCSSHCAPRLLYKIYLRSYSVQFVQFSWQKITSHSKD